MEGETKEGLYIECVVFSCVSERVSRGSLGRD